MPFELSQEFVSLISTPVIVVFILIEFIYSFQKGKFLYSWKETLTNLYLTLITIGFNLLTAGFYLFVFTFFYEYRLFKIENAWLYWFALIVIQDFLYYWLHYVDHYSRFFWAIHVTHHNSTEYNLTTGFRSSVFQPFYRFIYYFPLACMGFEPLDILVVYSVTQIWGIFVHTQTIKKLPNWMEAIFVTPSHHRVHHASNVVYLDKNMGMFLIIWDKLFGTFQKELDEEPVVYGLTTNPENRGPLNIIFHEFKAIFKDLVAKKTNLVSKIKYVFYPPGWSHDGSTMTSSQLRKEWHKKKTI
jgi:sterol desaturase/sphingolipid hydroxylase (fatty acid hydroxylase superfamily)